MIAPALALLVSLAFVEETPQRVKSDAKAAVKETGDAGRKFGKAVKTETKEAVRDAKPTARRFGQKFKALGKDIAQSSKQAAKDVKAQVTKK